MWSVWEVTGRDPYAIYHDLDDDFVPVGGGEPMPPPYPERRRAVLFAFGVYSFEMRAKLAGSKVEEDPVLRAARERQKQQERAWRAHERAGGGQ